MTELRHITTSDLEWEIDHRAAECERMDGEIIKRLKNLGIKIPDEFSDPDHVDFVLKGAREMDPEIDALIDRWTEFQDCIDIAKHEWRCRRRVN
jgi:hypothetical protein